MNSLVSYHGHQSWELNSPHLALSQKIAHQLTSMCRELKTQLQKSDSNEIKKKAVFRFYRRYYTLTLNKSYQALGLNSSPTRDHFLDFPWKECQMNRVECLKIWEKINT